MSPYLPEAHCTQRSADREIICEFPDDPHDGPGKKTRSLSGIAVRVEAKEVRPDTRPQARENRRCIHWNIVRIFPDREDADGCGSFATAERSMSDRLLDSGSAFSLLDD